MADEGSEVAMLPLPGCGVTVDNEGVVRHRDVEHIDTEFLTMVRARVMPFSQSPVTTESKMYCSY